MITHLNFCTKFSYPLNTMMVSNTASNAVSTMTLHSAGTPCD